MTPEEYTEYWKEFLGAIVLIRERTQSYNGGVTEVLVADMSPEGEYVKFYDAESEHAWWEQVDQYMVVSVLIDDIEENEEVDSEEEAQA